MSGAIAMLDKRTRSERARRAMRRSRHIWRDALRKWANDPHYVVPTYFEKACVTAKINHEFARQQSWLYHENRERMLNERNHYKAFVGVESWPT